MFWFVSLNASSHLCFQFFIFQVLSNYTNISKAIKSTSDSFCENRSEMSLGAEMASSNIAQAHQTLMDNDMDNHGKDN